MALRTILTLSLLLLTGSVQAQSAPSVEQIRLGLPSGQGGDRTGRSRRGAWAPVYVDLKSGTEGHARGQFQVAILARDTEQALARYLVPVPALPGETTITVVGYIRPEGLARVEVQVTDLAGNVKSSATATVADLNREILGSGPIFYVTLGSRLGLARALRPEADKKNQAILDDPEGEDLGLRRYAYLGTTKDLPDRWFGYDAADVVILPTGNDSFVRALVEGDPARRAALAEWVARGGKLVLSVGRNHQLVRQLLAQTRLIDVALKGSHIRDALHQVHGWVGGENPPTKVEIADIDVGPDASVLIREMPEGTDRGDRAVVVQGSHGLGRVILVCFDLEGEAFAEWSGSKLFWKKLDEMLAPRPQAQPRPDAFNPRGGFDPGTQRGTAELEGELRRQLETFADVPVISFGWVALFILFYIFLVGPFDYFILKKWFKRLEWTWITFPTIVVLVSVGAYLAAYYAKSDDLRINEINLVEVDLHPGAPDLPQVYGTTWFSVFSPRIKNYTLGIEPSPDWAAPTTGLSGTTLCLLASPEEGSRIASQGLYPQPYDYAPDATGVERLPIPVWASRAFEARWHAPAKEGAPPIAAALTRSRVDEKSVQGPITNNLDVALEGVVLFHDGKMYPVGTLQPGDTRRVEHLLDERQSQQKGNWKNDGAFHGTSGWTIKGMLFPELTQTDGSNSGLRYFDQSWRLDAQPELPARRDAGANYRPEIVLVGRLTARTGPGRDMNTAAGTPTRLWLDRLPAAAATVPDLEGTLHQETYLRVYIPVRR